MKRNMVHMKNSVKELTAVVLPFRELIQMTNNRQKSLPEILEELEKSG